MSSDVNKKVEVAFTISGLKDQKVLDTFQKKLGTLQKKVEAFQNSLDSIKHNPEIDKIATSMEKLSKIKLPSTDSFANGLEKLSKVGPLPDLAPFVTELKKFEAVKSLPGVNQLANGFIKLSETSLHIDQVGAKIRVLVRNLKKFNDVKAVPNLNSLIKSLDGLKKIKDFGDLDTRINNLAKSISKFNDVKTPSVTKLTNGFKELIKLDIKKVVTTIDGLRAALERLDKKGSLTVFKTFAKDLSEVNKVINKSADQTKKAQEAFSNLGNTIQAQSKKVRTFGDRLAMVAQYRVIFEILQGLNNGFRGGVDAIISYDQALKDLQAITGASSREIEVLSQKVKQVAADTKFSAVEVAEGMRTLGQAGLTTAESIQSIDAVSNLASGTLTDMASTVDLMTTAMRAFNISTNDSSRVSDIFANAVNRSKLTMEKLRTAMNYIGPLAHNANISLEEVVASLGVLANSGLRASTSSTGLRQVLATLLDPSEKLADALKKVGLSLEDVDPKTNSFSVVLQNLKRVLQESGNEFDLFGKRGAAAIIALTKPGQFNVMLGKMTASGTAARMASIQLEGLEASFKNLVDRAKNLALAIGDAGLSDVFRTFIDVAKGVLSVLTLLAETSVGKVIISLGTLAAVVGTVVVAFKALAATQVGIMLGNLISQIVAASGAFTGLGVAGSTAFGPIVIAVLGVVGAITALSAAMDALDFEQRANEAQNMADRYGQLGDEIETYRERTSGMSRNSEELKNANLALRKSLINVAVSFEKDLSVAAEDAIESIDAFTGKVLDGGKALKAYQEILSELEVDKLVEAGKLLAKKYDNPYAVVTGGLDDLRKKIIELEEKQRKTNFFEGFLLKGGIEELKKEYAVLSEFGLNAVNSLADQGKITLQDTAERMREVAREAGFTGKMLEIIVDTFERISQSTKGVEAPSIIGPDPNAYDAQEYERKFKTIEEAYKQMMHNISLDEAEGLKSHQEAEAAKAEATMNYYRTVRDAAREQYNAALETDDGKEIQKRFKAMKQAQSRFYDESRKLLDNSVADESRANEKILSLQEKLTRELQENVQKLIFKEEDYQDSREKLERQSSDKIANIRRALSDKLEKIEKKKVTISQKVNSDIISLEMGRRNDILSIQQRGMSDEQKSFMERVRALDEFRQAHITLQKGIEAGDKKQIEVAKKLFESVKSRAEAFEEEGTAVQLVGKAYSGLKDTVKAIGDIDLADKDAEISKAKAIAAEKEKKEKEDLKNKLSNLDKRYKRENQLEKERHTLKMKDLNDEIKKYNEILSIAKKIKETAGAATTTASAPAVSASTGARIPGYGGGDTVPALVERGEWIINKDSVRKYGDRFMSMLNAGRLAFNKGGSVSRAMRGLSSTVSNSANRGLDLSDFGTVEFFTGDATIPAIVHQDVIGQLETRMRKIKRFGS